MSHRRMLVSAWLPPAIALLVLALFCLGCSRSLRFDRLVHADGEEVLAHEVTEGVASLVVQVRVRLRDGAVAWKLIDPAGVLRWQDRIDGRGRISEVQRFAAVAGDWTLALDFEDASGRYSVALTDR